MKSVTPLNATGYGYINAVRAYIAAGRRYDVTALYYIVIGGRRGHKESFDIKTPI